MPSFSASTVALLALTLTLVVIAFVAPVRAADPAPATDSAAVERACRDYVDAIYDLKPELIDRSVSPNLVKSGFGFNKKEGVYKQYPMSFAQLRELAASYNKDGKIPKDAPRDVVVLGVLDSIATAKLTASWGVDYFQLAKEGGRWRIRHILWQSHPPASAGTETDAVRRACLDYAEGIYLVKPENIDRAVHRDLVKVGFVQNGADPEPAQRPMSFDQLRTLAAQVNKDGKFGPSARKEVEVLDAMDQTACAKLTAEWGIDSFHLAKFDGQWKIVQVVWQNHRSKPRAE
ncbi:MAG TPA: hypothetical protein DEB06_03435 [Phycisphaerales bacterium]|nr:hypothetical protein [Phycisphaerales bacterium]